MQIEKMSKTKFNGISPDEIIEEFGADTLRLYEMFLGPFDREKLWNTDAASGCRRFLNRFFEMVTSKKVKDEENEEALKLGNRLVDLVTKDLEAMQFNTAIAKMMEFINNFTKLEIYTKSALKMAIQMLYPFAPHVSEELWEYLQEKKSLAYHPWPKVDEKYLKEDMTTYVIQINGKVRETFHLLKDKTKENILELAIEQPKIKKHLKGKIIKTIFVPNKLLNIVVK
jgi:leucyl-tRNA synthetase